MIRAAVVSLCLLSLACEIPAAPVAPAGYSGSASDALPAGHFREGDPALGRILDAVVIHAEAVPGELDRFTVFNATGAPMILRLETLGTVPGDCETDTRVEVHATNSGSSLLAEDDDSGIGFCSEVRLPLAPQDSAFVRVEGDGAYLLAVEFE